MADANIPAEESGRAKVTRRIYIDSKGQEAPRVMPDVVSARIVFLQDEAPYDTLELDFSTLEGFSDLPFGVARQAIAWGLVTKVTNSAGSAKLSVDEKVENCAQVWTVISAGRWLDERESAGPKTSDLVEAVSRFQDKIGKPWDDAARAAFVKRIEDEGERKRIQSIVQIDAIIKAIRLERQQARAAAAAARAEAAGLDANILGF